MQHGIASFCLALIITKNISISHRSGCHQLRLAERFNGTQPIPQLCCFLKTQSFCRGLHGCPSGGNYLIVLSLQDQNRLINAFTICGERYRLLAPAGAIFQVKVQTGAVFSPILRECFTAPWQLEG